MRTPAPDRLDVARDRPHQTAESYHYDLGHRPTGSTAVAAAHVVPILCEKLEPRSVPRDQSLRAVLKLLPHYLRRALKARLGTRRTHRQRSGGT